MSRLEFASEAFAELSARDDVAADLEAVREVVARSGTERRDGGDVAKRIWDDLITEQDRAVYSSGMFGGEAGIGTNPAVVVVDVLNKSIGDEPLPILDAMARFGKSCTGEYGWAAIPHIQAVIAAARAGGFRVIYTIPQDPRLRPAETLERFEEKMPNWSDYSGEREGYNFANEIAPEAGDMIIEKPTASSFYRTDLEDQLRAEGIDCLVVTGGATSGCVRGDRRRRPRARAQGQRAPRRRSSTAARSPTP